MNDDKIKCLLCDTKPKLVHDNFLGYQESMIFKIYLCENCETSFPSPKVDASQLYDFIYEKKELIPGYDRYWKYFKRIKDEKNPLKYLADSEECYWGVREALQKIDRDKSDLKILEIGSGLGYLTFALQKEGYNVKGMDISEEAVENAKKQFGDYFLCADLFEFTKTNIELFDAIILTEVIEHVENPVLFLEAMVKLVKKDGCIILTTPNRSIAPLDVIWDTESPPIHNWWFSEKSIELMAKNNNLETDFVNFKNFYNQKPKGYRLAKAKKNLVRQPIIGENWGLIRNSKLNEKSSLKLKFKSFTASMPFLKSLFIKIKPGTFLLSERGVILCAILRK